MMEIWGTCEPSHEVITTYEPGVWVSLLTGKMLLSDEDLMRDHLNYNPTVGGGNLHRLSYRFPSKLQYIGDPKR